MIVIDFPLSFLALTVYFYIWYIHYKVAIDQINLENNEEEIDAKKTLDIKILYIGLLFVFYMFIIVITLIIVKNIATITNLDFQNISKKDIYVLLTVLTIFAVGTKVCVSFNEFYIDVAIDKDRLENKDYVISQMRILYCVDLLMILLIYIFFILFQAVIKH